HLCGGHHGAIRKETEGHPLLRLAVLAPEGRTEPVPEPSRFAGARGVARAPLRLDDRRALRRAIRNSGGRRRGRHRDHAREVDLSSVAGVVAPTYVTRKRFLQRLRTNHAAAMTTKITIAVSKPWKYWRRIVQRSPSFRPA